MANSVDKTSLRISVCYVTPAGKAWLRELSLPEDATVQDALMHSEFSLAFGGLDPWKQGVGVFGQVRQADSILRDGDRVEIYRPLSFDPKESRRRRADHRRAKLARETKGGRMRPAGLL
jgi:uncharacterized protein